MGEAIESRRRLYGDVAIISANLGNFDPPGFWTHQKGATMIQFTDNNFAPRSQSMTPRLQARIPKMFGWQMVPGYDVYIWCDASFAMQRTDSTSWLLDQLRGCDLAFFRHPDRRTIQQEYEFIKRKVEEGNKYLSVRYKDELIEDQMAAIAGQGYVDDTLYASCAFVYRNCLQVQACLKEWWYHTSRYHSVDQLALPFVVRNSGCAVSVINENIYKIPYLTYIRNKR